MRRLVLHLTAAALTFSIGLFFAILARGIHDKSLPCYDPRTSPTVTGIGRQPCQAAPTGEGPRDVNEPTKALAFDNIDCWLPVKNIRDFPARKTRKAKRHIKR